MTQLQRQLVLLVLVAAGAALVNGVASQSVAQQYLDAHNAARGSVGVGGLSWDNGLATYAGNWARTRSNAQRSCQLRHSGGPYGENIFWSSGSSTPAQAVNAWVDERQYYDYNSNTCAANQVCGHYTQVVWRNSVLVGCGSAICPGGGLFVVCSYNPSGNFNEERPYNQYLSSILDE